MTAILICWAIAGAIGWFGGKYLMNRSTDKPEKEEGAGVCESSAYLPILRDAFKTLSPNSRGRGSIAFLNLSTAIQRIEAGEELAPGVLVYLLNQIEGGAPWAEQIKGAGA